jgi:hypothetical protein
LSFLRHKKIYQSDGLKRELNCSFNSLTDHRSDESSTGYSFMSCSPAELMSASPVQTASRSTPAAVKLSAANRNCHYFSLSQPKGPLHSLIMAEIVPASEDLFFDEVVRGYVEGNRRFVHRPWLADIVEKSLSYRNRPFILMTAEPGAGKSTFLAQLAHDHPNWLRYFIRRDQRSVLSDVSAKSLLLRIGYTGRT